MKDLLLTLLDLAVTTAKLCGPGGVRAVIAENLLLKQQLIVLRRARQRAPNLTLRDRLLCGFGSLLLSPGRIRKVGLDPVSWTHSKRGIRCPRWPKRNGSEPDAALLTNSRQGRSGWSSTRASPGPQRPAL